MNVRLKQVQLAVARMRKRRWYRVVTVLSCVVVFCTVYALILPAITMEKCALEEHTHMLDCYTQVTTREVRAFSCPVTGAILHTHNDLCRDAGGNLICTLPELSAHIHGEDCYCAHTHDDGCWEVSSELVCTAHVHTAECFQSVLTCTAHACTEGCLDEAGNPTCEAPHTHDESCYTEEKLCTLEDHTHESGCYEENRNQICTLEEGELVLTCERTERIPHTHDGSCYEGEALVCTREEWIVHDHDDGCFALTQEPVDTEALTCTDENHEHNPLCYGTWELTCVLPEHTHGPECTPEPWLCALEEHTHTEQCPEDCAVAEHTHTEQCLSDDTADVETAAKWEAELAKLTLTGDWRVDVLTIAQSQLGYSESTANFRVDEKGVRHGYTRFGRWNGNPYEEWCADFAGFCIYYAQVEKMPFSASCGNWIRLLTERELYHAFDPEAEEISMPGRADLIFFDFDGNKTADHVGFVLEVVEGHDDEKGKLITLEGNIGNRVAQRVYDLDDPSFFGWAELPEQTFYCGMQGHAHSEECTDCALTEHIHTDACKVLRRTLTAAGEDYTVSVVFGLEAGLPEEVTLSVREIDPASEEYAAYLSLTGEAVDPEETVVFARFFDVQFLLDGETLEPEGPVDVTITYTESPQPPEEASCHTVHFGTEGTELLDTQSEWTDDGTATFTHTQEGFSVVGTVMSMKIVNAADIGPNLLPVDYYVLIDGVWTCVGSTFRGTYAPADASGWTDYNRDYVTLEQVASILGEYGFTNNPRNVAYQQKTNNLKVFSDTNIVEMPVMNPDSETSTNQQVYPLARNHVGYNLYFIPSQVGQISSWNLSALPAENGFFTVSVYDNTGALLTSSVVRQGTSFTYDASASGITQWLASGNSGTAQNLTGSTLTLAAVTDTMVIRPRPENMTENGSVTFKVLLDGVWQSVGSLPYYLTESGSAAVSASMAKPFFGPYGFTGEEGASVLGFSYNDIYRIGFKTDTNYVMDVAGANYANNTTVQLYQSNDTPAQRFRIHRADDTYFFISPVANSAYHVNALGAGTSSGTKIVLWDATDNASRWKVVTGSDGYTSFYSANAPDTAPIDVPNGKTENGNPLQIWVGGSAIYWKLDQKYMISNNAAVSQSVEGSLFTTNLEANGDIVCYYLPAEKESTYNNAGEEALSVGNGFWTVKVVDQRNTVYSKYEQDALSVVAPHGSTPVVQVRNADGMLWSCSGKGTQELDTWESQEEGISTFKILNISQPVTITLTTINPSFTVQYYAYIPRFAASGDASLTVIDTSGGKLPTNGGSMATRLLYLENTNVQTNQNAGVQTNLYRVKTELSLTQMYTDGTFEFQSCPTMDVIDKLNNNGNYLMKEVWVLKPGMSASSTNRDDWTVYTAENNTISFTNLASESDEQGVVLISEGSVLRLIYDVNQRYYSNTAAFYDYDISSAESNGVWTTGATGINSAGNYASATNWNAKTSVLAFGNSNCGTGMGTYVISGTSNTLNKYNSTNSGYGGCTFGIATGLSGGKIVYNSNISVPNLFNDGNATGKHTYEGSTLTFRQTGDTYTLTAASVSGGNGSRGDLDLLFNPSPASGTTHTHIYTNNFWPLDGASTANRTDRNWGLYNNPGSFSGYEETSWTGKTGNFPLGDDGRAHNWFFGMSFALTFKLTPDYIGPLEYYFFGDDDLWVFLDNKLVCDIGGVHSSIGEYVNLRDYLPVGSETEATEHTLSFFYTERGASGSTCYMNFTLPSVSSASLPAENLVDLQLSKAVVDTDGKDITDQFVNEKFRFKVEFWKDSEDEPKVAYNYRVDTKIGTEIMTVYGNIKSGEEKVLKPNQKLTITNLPEGYHYRITELNHKAYWVSHSQNGGEVIQTAAAEGTVSQSNGSTNTVRFINTPYTELPQTGGAGVTGFYLLGAALLGLPLAWKRRRRNER